MRYGNPVGVISCAVYHFLMQTHGAIAIFASSVAVATIFRVPVIWTILVTGLTASVYTALGGLRGVVWTDSVQALLMVLTPIIVICKIAYDSLSTEAYLRSSWNIDISKYLFETSFDITRDETLWSCIIGLSPMVIYRGYIEQMSVQRFLAARSLADAKRTVIVGNVLTQVMCTSFGVLALSLAYWFRDCDPLLSGAIRKYDQILPFYVLQSLSDIPGFSGVFLAGVVGATTSTVSSIINSLATTAYVDIFSLLVQLPERKAAGITKIIGKR